MGPAVSRLTRIVCSLSSPALFENDARSVNCTRLGEGKVLSDHLTKCDAIKVRCCKIAVAIASIGSVRSLSGGGRCFFCCMK